MTLTESSMRRPVTTMMAFLSLIVIGAIATRLIPLELFPEFDAPFLTVDIPYPGSTPEEVERQITRPAEEVIATVSGIKRMRSDSREDRASIQLEFDWGEETEIKAIEVREKLEGIRDRLPTDVERIFVGQFSSSDQPILILRISSERDLSDAYELLNRKLKRPLERVEGVSKVELYGVNKKEVGIELIADRVAAHHVDLNRLSATLQRANFSVTAGRITDGGRRFVVRPIGELTTLAQIENVIVGPNGLRLADIARVTYDEPLLDHGRHLDRAYAVGMNISKEGGANTVAVTDRIIEVLDEVREDPEMQGITLYYMESSAEGIVSSLRDLLESGVIGGFFALLVLFFFLRRFSTTMIVTLAVPVSILVTVGFLYFLGLTLNILSMMGLMLAVGMLVDNAVVVTESIHRHQHARPDDPWGATLRGVREVALAVTAGTLTTAIVFLPMIVSPADQVTLFLKHVAIAIIVALVTSLVISLTVVPLLSARLKPPPPSDKPTLIDRMTGRYAALLDWLLRHRKASALLVAATLASVMIPASVVKQDFFPEENNDREIRLFYHINGTYTLERVEETVNRVEEYLFAHKDEFEIASVYTYYESGSASSTILLTEGDDAHKEVSEIQEAMRAGMPKLTIADPSFSWQRAGGTESVRVTLHGESSERLAELSRQVADVLAHVEGLTDVRSEAAQGEREIHVVVDRERARQYGFSSQQIAGTVAAAMRGQSLRRFRTPDGEVEMRLKFQDMDRQTLDHIRNLPIQRAGREPVKLAALADLNVRRAPRNIHREDRATMIGVTANLEGITLAEAQEKIGQVLGRYEFPTGYSWGYGQRFRDEEESQAIMLMNLLLALALIYLVMAGLFESLIHPAAIWTSILFAIVGVFWFFLVTDTVFSIMAWIGILILVGVVVNNGIVLIDHINLLRAKGLPRHEAIVRAGRERMRPILMTAATTVLGLIPLCIGNTQIGGDGPPYYPMARAIVGGLTFSTVVTLIILPSIYVMLDDVRIWSRKLARAASR